MLNLGVVEESYYQSGLFEDLLEDIVIVSGVAGRTPKNICLRCDLQFQYPAQPDTEKLEIDLRQIFFGGRPATPDTSIPQLYNQAIFGTRIRKCLNFTHASTDNLFEFSSQRKNSNLFAGFADANEFIDLVIPKIFNNFFLNFCFVKRNQSGQHLQVTFHAFFKSNLLFDKKNPEN